ISGLYALAFIGMIGGLYAVTTTAISDRLENAQPHWENLKVLPQDISKDSLEHLMKGYAKSLGVRCSFCHAPRKDNPKKLDFPSDKKMHKKIARGMIEMTNAINADYFRPHYPDPKPQQVTDVKCIMCHRGNPNPKRYLKGVQSLYPQADSEKE